VLGRTADQSDSRTEAGESDTDAAPNAAASARDERDPTFKRKPIEL
jgi:hypothetical protein